MNEKERQDKIAWLKKALEELDNLGEEEFGKVVSEKFGEKVAVLCSELGFAKYAREMLRKTWQEELRQLGG